MNSSIFSLVALFTCLSFTPPLAAQTSAADVAAANKLSQEGHRALDRNEFARAVDRFESAEARAHSPANLVGIGKALVGLGRLADAYQKFEGVVQSGVPAKSPRLWQQALAEAQAEIARLKPQLAWLTITVTGPMDPSVRIDDASIPSTELGARRPVDPGKRTLVVSAPGFITERRTLALEPGAVESADFILRSAGKAAPTQAAAEAKPMQPAALYTPEKETNDVSNDEGRQTRRALTYAAFGVGGVGLVAGGVFGALALNKRKDLESTCGSDRACPAAEQSTLDDYHMFGTISGVSFGFAIAGAGTGVALLLTEPSQTSKDKQQSFNCAPFVGFGTFGARGKF